MSFLRTIVRPITFSIAALLGLSTQAHAALITQADIESIIITAPNKWKAYNTDLLFDGNSDRYAPKRFAGYQHGSAKLSEFNPFSIDISFNNVFSISSVGFFNDWRHHLDQQVSSMNINFFDENKILLSSSNILGLQQNTYSALELINFNTPLNNVKSIEFAVTGHQSDHFEIRELLIEGAAFSDQQGGDTSTIDNPPILGLFGVFLLSIIWFCYPGKLEG